MKKQWLLLMTVILASSAQADRQILSLSIDRLGHDVHLRAGDRARTFHKRERREQVREHRQHRREHLNHLRDQRDYHQPRNGRKDAGDDHPRWQTVSAFRGRTGKQVTRSIPVRDQVSALSLRGTKRGMVVRRAHAVLGNGRWVRLHNLEGRLRNGELHRQRLRSTRHVQRVVLEIVPHRHKRGYAELNIKS